MVCLAVIWFVGVPISCADFEFVWCGVITIWICVLMGCVLTLIVLLVFF